MNFDLGYATFYLMLGLSTLVTAIGASFGQARATQAASDAINKQPEARSSIVRALMISLVLIETAGLLGFVISFILMFRPPVTYWGQIASIGTGLAISIPGLAIGLVSALPGMQTLNSISRQPFAAKKIINFLLLTQSVMQTALIFGFLIALITGTQLSSIQTATQAAAYIAGGLCMAIGSIGPIIGVSHFTNIACTSLGLNQNAYGRLTSFALISQAIIETPVILATIISFLLIRCASLQSAQIYSLPTIIILFCVAFVMGVGTLMPGISSGRTAAAACNNMVMKPELSSTLSRTSLIAQGIIDTSAIYAFIIAILLLLVLR